MTILATQLASIAQRTASSKLQTPSFLTATPASNGKWRSRRRSYERSRENGLLSGAGTLIGSRPWGRKDGWDDHEYFDEMDKERVGPCRLLIQAIQKIYRWGSYSSVLANTVGPLSASHAEAELDSF